MRGTPRTKVEALRAALVLRGLLIQHGGDIEVHEFRATGETRARSYLNAAHRRVEFGVFNEGPTALALWYEVLDEIVNGPPPSGAVLRDSVSRKTRVRYRGFPDVGQGVARDATMVGATGIEPVTPSV